MASGMFFVQVAIDGRDAIRRARGDRAHGGSIPGRCMAKLGVELVSVLHRSTRSGTAKDAEI